MVNCSGCGVELKQTFVGCQFGNFCSEPCHRMYHPQFYMKRKMMEVAL